MAKSREAHVMNARTAARVKQLAQSQRSANVRGVDTSSGRQVVWLTVTGDPVAGEGAGLDGWYPCRVEIGADGEAFAEFGYSLCKSHNNQPLTVGERYQGIRQKPKNGESRYRVLGPANWSHKTGTVEDAWQGGIISTGSQSLRGAKTFRDTLTVEHPENDLGSTTDGAVYLSSTRATSPLSRAASVQLRTEPTSLPGAGYTAGIRVEGAQGLAQVYLHTASFTSFVGGSSVFCSASGGFMLLGSAYGINGLGGVTEEVTVDGTTLKFVGGIYVGRVSTDPPPPPPPPPGGQGTLRVLVFSDTDDDGVRDSGEPGIANRLVTVSGSVGLGAITDASGYCDFVNLAPGDFAVTVALQSGETCATNGGTATVVADTVVDVQRAIVLSPPPATSGAVSIVVVKDGTDYLNRTVAVDGPTPMSGTSAAYLYPISAGDYTATVTPSGDTGTWTWSIAGGASGSGTTTGEFTSDGLTVKTVTFNLTSPPPPPPPPPTTYSISGNVTLDSWPLAERPVNIIAGGSGSGTTDINGDYSITGLAAGTYTIQPEEGPFGETSDPVSREVTLGPSATNQDFALTSGMPP